VNASHAKAIPFDEVMYHSGSHCKTCDLPKPARSKHCKICNVCIHEFDHHCVWINGCVSRSNYLRFLVFAGTHAFVTLYGSYLLLGAQFGAIRKRYDENLFLLDVFTYYELFFAFIDQCILFGYEHKVITLLAICCISLSIALPVFVGYHLRNLIQNFTTNERYKVSQLEFGLR